jgi:hypothetical protein
MNLFDGVGVGTDANIGSIYELINNIAMFALTLAGTLAVIFIIIGGIQLSLSAGNPQGQEKAKKTITNAIGGLVLAICAGAIGQFILGAFGL